MDEPSTSSRKDKKKKQKKKSKKSKAEGGEDVEATEEAGEQEPEAPFVGTEEEKKKKVEEIMDEYYALDHEDMVSSPSVVLVSSSFPRFDASSRARLNSPFLPAPVFPFLSDRYPPHPIPLHQNHSSNLRSHSRRNPPRNRHRTQHLPRSQAVRRLPIRWRSRSRSNGTRQATLGAEEGVEGKDLGRGDGLEEEQVRERSEGNGIERREG